MCINVKTVFPPDRIGDNMSNPLQVNFTGCGEKEWIKR